MAFHHVSVMPEEVIGALVTDPDGTYVDCTLGGAGHARRIAERLSPKGRLIGLDQDAEAIAAARGRLADFPCHIDIVHSNFRRLGEVLSELKAPPLAGVLFDLGVSSHQLDTAERGFSYMQDAPLDMRMNPEAGQNAADVVNTYSEEELARIFHDYGEERWGKRIAEFIVKARAEKPIERTGELVDIVSRAVPKAVRRAQNGHPAKRIFQAIRIEVNDELGILEAAFKTAVQHLRPGGRIAILTFHSLEDRIAKRTLQEMARGCICPPELPVCVCHHQKEVRLLGKARKATKEELAENSRAKSAKLRVAEKLATKQEEVEGHAGA